MSNYFFKKFFCLLLMVCITNYSSKCSSLPDENRYPNHSLYGISQQPWRFMEQIFLIDPELETKKKFPQIMQIAAIVAGAIPGSIWFLNKGWEPAKEFCNNVFAKNKTIYSSLNKNLLGNTVGSLALTIVLSYVLYAITHEFFAKKIHHDALKTFVVTWPNNKQYTPTVLHELFDYIYQEYSASASEKYLKNITPDVISQLSLAIYEQYPEKYAIKPSLANVIPRWLQWTIMALSTAVIIKLVASATKDFFTIIDATPLPRERKPTTIEDFYDKTDSLIPDPPKQNETTDGDHENQKKRLDPETKTIYDNLLNQCENGGR